jgi:hypothetical protein
MYSSSKRSYKGDSQQTYLSLAAKKPYGLLYLVNLSFAVPENDKVVDNLLEMRQNLNWVTEIPRHGPDCRKDMEILKDQPLTEKV